MSGNVSISVFVSVLTKPNIVDFCWHWTPNEVRESTHICELNIHAFLVYKCNINHLFNVTLRFITFTLSVITYLCDLWKCNTKLGLLISVTRLILHWYPRFPNVAEVVKFSVPRKKKIFHFPSVSQYSLEVYASRLKSRIYVLTRVYTLYTRFIHAKNTL